ncbi:hypothetical protein [Magnetospirillum sp. UT-4]|uniref:hypothetical protein n=1 Tax=Magnetospirillum sp. UT-4 TaxID=2681467 RepID=UPI0013859AEB|nr:hypothetical protein [Magnetospirillum sp. UT-4]CAA7612936.1 hypothetical protein MTBUT4_120106 [Magnetospirillum sp. UT-4]
MSRPPRFSDIQKIAYDIATRTLERPGTAGLAAALVTEAADAFFAHVCDSVGNLRQKAAAVACGPGCASCCHQVVGLTVAEGTRLTTLVEWLAMSPELQA